MSCQTARLGTHLLARGGGEKLSGGCCAHAGEPGPQKELGWGRASPPQHVLLPCQQGGEFCL